MTLDYPGISGSYDQRREFFFKKITRSFPNRANDTSLVYGDPELEYYRLVNAGEISDVVGDGTVWYLGVGTPEESNVDAENPPLSANYLDVVSGDLYIQDR